MNEINSLLEDIQRGNIELTHFLERIKYDKKWIEEERQKIDEELIKDKYDIMKNLLTITIINEELAKLPLKGEKLNSVFEILNELSLDKRFIDKRQNFEEIFNDYEKIVKDMENSKCQEQIYKRYGLEKKDFEF